VIVADPKKIECTEDFLTLARLALGERPQDVPLFLTKVARRYRSDAPDVATELSALLKSSSARSSALRRETATALPLPVDGDSRLHLVRVERPANDMSTPIFTPEVEREIESLIRERRQVDVLADAGLDPTRSALFVGPPGVGKTMSARWIAAQLGLPLLILDLSAVMSSFLGRTGNNVRAVLDYAKRQSCVLLLDELDAIAKRRDDATEIGELKRLVTVLLQEIDEWPANGLLLAATNHPELLDPAVWRRFDSVVRFPAPERNEVEKVVLSYLGTAAPVKKEWVDILAAIFSSSNFSFIEKRVIALRRAAAMNNREINEEIEGYLSQSMKEMTHPDRIALANQLYAIPGMSQRRVGELTGVSRDTLRKRTTKRPKAGAKEASNG
jgi:SpoVK/Ycf46/Vps4 family AAA+-type ATPase